MDWDVSGHRRRLVSSATAAGGSVKVVDHFHLVALANDAVTQVRRRLTWELKDRRGGKIDPE